MNLSFFKRSIFDEERQNYIIMPIFRYKRLKKSIFFRDKRNFSQKSLVE